MDQDQGGESTPFDKRWEVSRNILVQAGFTITEILALKKSFQAMSKLEKVIRMSAPVLRGRLKIEEGHLVDTGTGEAHKVATATEWWKRINPDDLSFQDYARQGGLNEAVDADLVATQAKVKELGIPIPPSLEGEISDATKDYLG